MKDRDPAIPARSGILVGLGEGRTEVPQAMDDGRSAEIDVLTVGQYLRPTREHRHGGDDVGRLPAARRERATSPHGGIPARRIPARRGGTGPRYAPSRR